MSTSRKQRIAKSYRLRVRLLSGGVATIAYSEKIHERLQRHVTRIGSTFVILRGEGDTVMEILHRTVYEMPEHFTEESRDHLNYVGYEEAAAA
jgi:hypothetical protein